LALNIREATNRFPRRGYAELKAQTTSAAESIVNNIVEGCGATSQKEFARFLGMAIKSSMELEGQLKLAQGYGIVSEASHLSLERQTTDTRRMVIGLRKKVLANDLSKSISYAPTHNAKRTPNTAPLPPQKETGGP